MSREDILELQQWCTDHSHGDLYNRLEECHERVVTCELKIFKLEQLCKQCYLESKGEGP